jgi:hypothetical protein
MFAAATQAAWAVTPVPAAQYEIEVLVFENRLPELEGGELWVNEPRIDRALLDEAVTMGTQSPSDAALSRAAALLEKDGHYRVLAHLRWQQTAEAKSATKPVRIRGLDPALDGALRFYLSRFLHVDLALLWRPLTKIEPGMAPPPTAAYWIDEHRRVRTKTLHYFDHPKFGALVRIVQLGKD